MKTKNNLISALKNKSINRKHSTNEVGRDNAQGSFGQAVEIALHHQPDLINKKNESSSKTPTIKKFLIKKSDIDKEMMTSNHNMTARVN